MRHEFTNRAGRWLAMLLLTMASALLLAVPAQAAARTPQVPRSGSDTVTLSITNGTTFTYGGTQQLIFKAVVDFGTAPTANYFWGISVQIEDGEGISGSNSPDPSSNGLTLTFSHMTSIATIPVGRHFAVASFFNPGTKTTTYSNSVSFTVNKATPNFTCSIDGTSDYFVGAGKSLHISMAPTGQVPVDWQDTTYTVTLDGPTHLKLSNLAPDSNDEVTVTSPSQVGKYLLGCMFNGTASFNAVPYNDTTPYTVSALHSLESVELFTNPTTLTANTKMDFDVVFHAAAGLPAPTGEFNIYIGDYYYTDSIQIGSNGTTLVHLNPLPTLVSVSKITIHYWGDIYYNEAEVNFPLTNPPIPSGGGSGSTGGTTVSGNSTQATASATAGKIASATETATV